MARRRPSVPVEAASSTMRHTVMSSPTRYACFEIRTSCDKCGQPVPVNGPLLRPVCTHCSATVPIPEERIAGFLLDFEDDAEALEQGEGHGATVIAGRTYNYAAWELPPRCHVCKKPLPEPETGTDGSLGCASCNATHTTYPAPEWLTRRCPTAAQIFCAEREEGDEGKEAVVVDDAAAKPVVFSCPQCGAGLSITRETSRVHACQYCSADVYMPDELWKRLHPVKAVREWFVRFEGLTSKERYAERRPRDLAEQEADLARRATARVGGSARGVLKLAAIVVPLLAIILFAVPAAVVATGGTLDAAVTVSSALLLFVAAVALVRYVYFGRIVPRANGRKAIGELARKHGWKEGGGAMDSVRAELEGREIKINQEDMYAVQVDVNEDSPFALFSDPPGWSTDDKYRIRTGGADFDELFPIRYAVPEVAERIESSSDDLAWIVWFVRKWKHKIARMKFDWAGPGVHLHPGAHKGDSDMRYLLPQDIEPVLLDLVEVAKATDARTRGQDFPSPPAG